MSHGVLKTTQNPATGVATTIATAGTIRVTEGYQRYTNVGACTAVLMTAGEMGGDSVIIQNDGSGSITFATAGTSKVLDGANVVIAVQRARQFVWDSVASLWTVLGVS